MLGTKKCPYCAEKIRSKAIKCRYCGSDIFDKGSNGVVLARKSPEQGQRSKKRRWLLLLVFAVLLVIFYNSVDPETVSRPTTSRRAKKEPQDPAWWPTGRTTTQLSSAVQPNTAVEFPAYTIISEDSLSNIKRSLDIRLDDKVSEEVLRSLALKLKSLDSRHYDRTFIGYYLPGMEVNAGAWATTRFNPDLEIRILGSTREQEELLRKQILGSSEGVVGTWLYQVAAAGSLDRTFTIYHQSGKLYLKTTYVNGSGGTELIEEQPHSEGRFFQTRKQAASDSGEYFLLNGQGDLQYCDKEGCFGVAKRID